MKRGRESDGGPSAQHRAAPGRPPDPSVEERAVSAAIMILLERGVRDCTVEEVARVSGVARATIFRRWGTRDGLLISAMRAMVVQAEPLPDTGDVVSDLVELVRRRATNYSGSGGRRIAQFALEVIARAHDDPSLASVLSSTAQSQQAQFIEILERGIARGEVAPDTDLQVLVDALYGCIWSHVLQLRPVDPADAERWVRTLVPGAITGANP